ncbi:MAG: SPOR domain-containing protein [Pseudomonadota bacterium]
MKWNASALAALFLLTACGGGGGITDYGPPESAGTQGSPAAQTWDGGNGRIDADLDSQQAAPAPSRQPGASYARPDSSYQRAPEPQYRPAADPAYPDPTAGASGPRGTADGRQKSDEVGYAGTRGVQGEGADGAVVAVHRSLPAGTIVEVTNLETGRTILVLVTGAMGQGDHLIDLSPGAARQLGAMAATTPVRVRRTNASPQDQNALQSGQAATDRPDTPPVLLNALRKALPSAAYAPAPRPASAGARPAAPVRTAPGRAAPTRGGYYVQVAALSNAANAQGLAQTLHGFVKPGGGLYRVQMGPFRTSAEAQAARADAARRGYGDARVFTQN